MCQMLPVAACHMLHAACRNVSLLKIVAFSCSVKSVTLQRLAMATEVALHIAAAGTEVAVGKVTLRVVQQQCYVMFFRFFFFAASGICI